MSEASSENCAPRVDVAFCPRITSVYQPFSKEDKMCFWEICWKLKPLHILKFPVSDNPASLYLYDFVFPMYCPYFPIPPCWEWMSSVVFSLDAKRYICYWSLKDKDKKHYSFNAHYIWRFPKMGVPQNHPLIDGFFLINHRPFRGTPNSGNHHIPYIMSYSLPQVQLPIPLGGFALHLLRSATEWLDVPSLWKHRCGVYPPFI